MAWSWDSSITENSSANSEKRFPDMGNEGLGQLKKSPVSYCQLKEPTKSIIATKSCCRVDIWARTKERLPLEYFKGKKKEEKNAFSVLYSAAKDK